jgi:nucleoside-diphosphate-sugar epimerase
LAAPLSVGRAVHVTSDEALTWTGLYAAIARAAGLSAEQFAAQAVYVPTDALVAAAPSQQGSLRGDKMHCAVFDTSLIKELVPGWKAVVPFSQGVAQAIAAFEKNPDWRTVDEEANAMFDRLGTIYRDALKAAESR